MKTFIVRVKEYQYLDVEVKAKSASAAMDKANTLWMDGKLDVTFDDPEFEVMDATPK